MIAGDIWRGRRCTEEGAPLWKGTDFSIVPKPHSFSAIVSTWPSLNLEIGVPESDSHFYKDGKWWFHHSDHKTGLVLLLRVHRQLFWVDVELWSEGLDINPQPDSLVLKQPLRVTRDEVTLLEGSSLDIHLDYEILMREARTSGQDDITITQQMLRLVCKEVGQNNGCDFICHLDINILKHTHSRYELPRSLMGFRVGPNQ